MATGDKIILFIDEIHTIVGTGSAEGAVDAGNILKPPLARYEYMNKKNIYVYKRIYIMNIYVYVCGEHSQTTRGQVEFTDLSMYMCVYICIW
jgi:hypothetical protein